ncbi:MAG: anaerobic ribonucleoside-triphosphate reductase activating protein [Lawsonibacter sp.]
MNYADIRPIDVANGPGVRVSLFVSGCSHHCKGCFNPETWDFDYGRPFGAEQEAEILALLGRSYIHGLSLLGGEPFEPQNQEPVLRLAQLVRTKFPSKDIWCYSGYRFEDLLAGAVGNHSRALLQELDVLVDGPFILEQKNLSLRFRGSENQRLIDVPASLHAGNVVLLDYRSN